MGAQMGATLVGARSPSCSSVLLLSSCQSVDIKLLYEHTVPQEPKEF